MEDVFEPSPGGGVGEYLSGQFITAQVAIRPEDLGAKGFPNLSEP